jgi:hypothetical protein
MRKRLELSYLIRGSHWRLQRAELNRVVLVYCFVTTCLSRAVLVMDSEISNLPPPLDSPLFTPRSKASANKHFIFCHSQPTYGLIITSATSNLNSPSIPGSAYGWLRV